jgi:hypothetical protein
LNTLLERLQRPGHSDVLESAVRELRPELPNGHEVSIAKTFLQSIDLLDELGRDFLRLASELLPDVIPSTS